MISCVLSKSFHFKNIINSSSVRYLNLSGIFNPTCIPFTNDGNIDFDALNHNIRIFENISFSGYILFGTTGEFPYLNLKEKINVLREFKHKTSPEKITIVGTGCESTDETIKLTNVLAKEGAHVALILPPYYYKGLSSDDIYLVKHFEEVADRCNIPVILYNMPKCTGVNLSINIILKLAQHPNIIGLKECDNNIVKLSQLNYALKCKNDYDKNGFRVLIGSASMLYPSLRLGYTSGGICAMANILGKQLLVINDILSDKNLSQDPESIEKANILHNLVMTTNEFLGRSGVPGLKVAMTLLGYRGGFPRPPLLPCSSQTIDEIKTFLTRIGIIGEVNVNSKLQSTF
ncbi:unnamed protein product [Gordionus sp. m RMFG-2023]|uniref:4-hydroxy-2-oxoglutarate aldolase, mitochondrial-like n=1 Tax=Gordionus sp. m RMFG-2023 TaxID=3053472 RepID=UPI0030E1AA56